MLNLMTGRLPLSLLLTFAVLSATARTASATEMKISAKALERTLRTQLFTGPERRYYMRGDAGSTSYVYADNPQVSFVLHRIVVHRHTSAKLATALRATCIRVSLNTTTDVSL